MRGSSCANRPIRLLGEAAEPPRGWSPHGRSVPKDRVASTAVTISLFDTAAQLREVREEVNRGILGVLDSGRFILGPEVEEFERELAGYLGVRHVVGVANGTDAITIALRGLGVGPGDDVVVPSFTFYASAEAIPHTGARPVFCDVDPDTFCVTAEAVERALTPATRAVIPVHLFGRVAPVGDLQQLLDGRGIAILEDSAQAAGARRGGQRAGSLADAATFSFFPSKNLFCFGDGGAIATNDDEVAEKARTLRFHGSRDKNTFTEVGWNSRLDALQAAVLRVTLGRLDDWNARRRALAAAYEQEGLAELVDVPQPAPDEEPVHHLYAVRAGDPDAVSRALADAGIATRSYYRVPVHMQPAMAAWSPPHDLPGTMRAAATNLALPMGPTLTADTARQVVEALRRTRA
jgi:dTDP-3-amino-3,4,6-trideoxy-alpha-D-glucose transaminase